MNSVTISIEGHIVPQGRPRASVIKTRFGGHAPKLTDPTKSRVFKRTVAWLAVKAMKRQKPFAGAIEVMIIVYTAVPRSWPKDDIASALADKIRPTGKPDIDNLIKSLCDGMNRIVYVDDSQIVKLMSEKRYSTTPGAMIVVSEWP